MKITILDHNHACIPPPVPSEVSAFLSYEEKGYNPHTGKWKQTRKHLVNVYGQFLAGLVPSLCARFPGTEVEDLRQFPPVSLQVPVFRPGYALRDYQIEYLTQCLTHERALLKATTAAGKTGMIAAVIAAYGLPTLLLVPTSTVRAQLFTELPKILPIDAEDETVLGTHKGCPRIMVALARNIHDAPDEVLRSYPLLIADEAHTCAAQQTLEVIQRTQAPFRFGFSATTTGRSDNRDLIVEGLFGPVIECVDHEELKERGYHPEIEVSLHYAGWEGDYAYMEDLLLVANTKRNEKIAQLALQESKHGPVLILVRRLEHGKALVDLLHNAAYVDGSTGSHEREEVRQAVRAGDIQILISTNVFAMGLDIPELRTGINAAGGKAPILTEQKLGRLTRPFGGEIKRWVDMADDFTTTFRRHSYERAAIYAQKADRVNLVGFPPPQEAHMRAFLAEKISEKE